MVKIIQKKLPVSKVLNVLMIVSFLIFLILRGFIFVINTKNYTSSDFLDTDGGKNYFMRGDTLGYRAFGDKTSENISLEHDSCTKICDGSVGSGINSAGPCLMEFYLNSENYAAFDVVPCEKGCLNGACVK
jgi:hypothetical protein